MGFDPTLRANVEIIDRTRSLAGSVFCPRCGWRLGSAESPAIGYLKRCSGCDRAIAIEFHDDILRISVGDERAQH